MAGRLPAAAATVTSKPFAAAIAVQGAVDAAVKRVLTLAVQSSLWLSRDLIPTIPQSRSERAQSHHCSQSAEYVVVTATIAPTLADDDSQTSALAVVAFELPPGSAAADSVHNLQLDTGPPNDIVVSFHRLVI